MKKDWNEQDVKRLMSLIDKEGKNKGIKIFSRESGRTENSIRIKLSRIAKEKIVDEAEEEAYKQYGDLAKAESKSYEEEDSKKNWFSKIINFFHNIW